MEDAMTKELLPCPHCESDRITVQHIRDGAQAICKDCGARSAPVFHGPEGTDATWAKARGAWNRRAAPQPAASDVPHDVVRAEAAVADIGMAEIETVARSDAKCDGRDFDGLGRADKERYRSRAWAGLRALATPAPSTSTAEGEWPVKQPTPPTRAPEWSTSTEEALRAENARLREALEFYADENRFGLPSEGPWGDGSTDFGNRARTALSALSR